ncbi:B3 domain-containing protein Os07g0563300-like isoform X2 [Wolffia australiana]
MTSSPSPSAGVAAPPSPARAKICYNLHCKEQLVDGSSPRRRGWRLRSGELAELCARCSSIYEQGSFCETFHSDGDGWRKCESCGKRVHCGCIVSVTMFTPLDAGGIECNACARKNSIPVPNHMSQSSFIFTLGGERLKDPAAKNWAQLNAPSPVPGQWRQASNMWKTFTQSDLQQRLSYEFDRPSAPDRLTSGQRLPLPPHHKKKADDPPVNRIQLDSHMNVNSSYGSPPVFGEMQREERCLVEETDPVSRRDIQMQTSFGVSGGIHFGALPNSSIVKDESPMHLVGLVSSLPSDSNNAGRITPAHSVRQQLTPQLAKQGSQSAHVSPEFGGEAQAQAKTARPRVDGRCRGQLLPRYWPRITDQELQQISGDSNSVVTPLFEKMLSASDAGRIGRLVLPKKCAEAYFPAISQPEGLPLKVQDANGQEWVFQFRFWPNNNSRMYVLEGVTPCIQSMKLQAGDTVTFSRMDPEGKLVMGYRKASNILNDQDIQAAKGGSVYPLTKELNRNGNKSGEGKSHVGSKATSSKVDKSLMSQNERTLSKPYLKGLIHPKRRASAPGSKNKRLRIENEDSIELKLTWEEAQELLQPPPNHKPSIVVIEGHEFEEYEEAPVLGRQTAFGMNEAGYPSPPALEATSPQPPDLATGSYHGVLAMAQKNKGKSESEAAALEAAEGLDALANLAILGEDPLSSSQQQAAAETAATTTRHPRHRPGCSCIVCIQPPSGKGPKHKPSCQCNVCLTVKRRFRTLMLRKEKRLSEKDAAVAGVGGLSPIQTMGLELAPSPLPSAVAVMAAAAAAAEEEAAGRKAVSPMPLPSPIKTPQIDLNIQPDREEEPSPVSDAGSLMRLLQDAAA